MIRLLLLAAVLCGSAGAEVHRVPSDECPTIQSAVDAASDGDTILVAAGTYVENISITNKTITLKSVSGPLETVLDGASKDSVVFYRAGEPGKTFLLEGFTIVNGAGKSLGGIQRRRNMPGKRKGKKEPPPMSGQGGGVYALHGKVEIRRNIIMGNNCFDGGGIHVSADCVIRDNVIAFNLATRQGGGVYLDKCPALCFNNHIISNTGGNSGGGIFLGTEDRAVRITDNMFYDNWSFYGGGIDVEMSTPVIARNLFYENKGCRGGAVLSRNEGADPLITNNIMDHNWACFGGGVCVRYKASARIVENVITNNTTHNHYCIQAPKRTGGDYSGGGLYFWESVDSLAASNLIIHNTAELHGGGVGCQIASPLLVGNTVYGNTAETDIGGLYCVEGAAPRVHHSIFWNNTPNEISDAALMHDCAVEGVADLDPMFVDAENLDFHLHEDSPLRDAGLPPLDLGALDFEGDPRIAGASMDIGADEFFPLETSLAVISVEPDKTLMQTALQSVATMVSAMEADLLHWYKTNKRDVFARVPVQRLLEYMQREGIALPRPRGNVDFPALSRLVLQDDAGLAFREHPCLAGFRITGTMLGRDHSGTWKPSGRKRVLAP